MTINTAGAVLAGGRSSRYGLPKMFELYHGKPLYQYSLDAFKEAGIQERYIITNNQLADRFDSRLASIVIEPAPFSGPLFGLKEALRQVEPDSWLFLLAADIPFVTPEFVASCLKKQRPLWINRRLFLFPEAGSSRCTVFIILPACLPLTGPDRKSSMKALLDEVSVLYVDYPRVRKILLILTGPKTGNALKKRQAK
ncbi:molybdenum cofactor guanylyltransferase [Sinobaca sp. H24]|uniref:molybdenum cofactor guanylyltransferase n=1 Tax=Sinobaca sp. H24 TaxID=2923376 RepID=UPI002079CF7E|nr:NTP transferase domain-containing protein [Sinobaca sp. H24]